jgi:hypothetical protein
MAQMNADKELRAQAQSQAREAVAFERHRNVCSKTKHVPVSDADSKKEEA